MAKAVISSTYDNIYLFNLPIVTWLWNKLGVDVICFMPNMRFEGEQDRVGLITNTIESNNLNIKQYTFGCPEHKEATYAQCSRLYAASLDLPKDEVLIVSDVDMIVFNLPSEVTNPNGMTIFGADLVPDGQYPMCYLSGTVNDWRNIIGEGTYQEHLDNLLGFIETEHFRGNYWGKDQEIAYQSISKVNHTKVNRARPQTQFASNRIDRDDFFWRDRLNLDVIDTHLWRPGYSEENFPKIIELVHYFYPNEDLQWMWEYRNEYLKLL